MPVLREHGFPATIFVPTKWIGARNAWDAPSDVSHELMTGEELAELAQIGFAVESHGHAHIDYARMDPRTVEEDVRSSVEQLTELLGRAPRYLAYPYGRATTAAAAEAARLGLSGAFGLDRPLGPLGDFALPRVPIVPADVRPLYALKTAGRYLAWRQSSVRPGRLRGGPTGGSQSMALALATEGPPDRSVHTGGSQRTARGRTQPDREGGERACAHAALVERHGPGRQRQLVTRFALAEVELADPERRRRPGQLEQQHQTGRVPVELGVVRREPGVQDASGAQAEVEGSDLVAGVEDGQDTGELGLPRRVHVSEQPAAAGVREDVRDAGRGVLLPLPRDRLREQIRVVAIGDEAQRSDLARELASSCAAPPGCRRTPAPAGSKPSDRST